MEEDEDNPGLVSSELNVEEQGVEEITRQQVRELLNKLPYREREVMLRRYGIGMDNPQTLDEVGRRFNVTREKVRQIDSQTLKKLEDWPEAQALKDPITPQFHHGGKLLVEHTPHSQIVSDRYEYGMHKALYDYPQELPGLAERDQYLNQEGVPAIPLETSRDLPEGIQKQWGNQVAKAARLLMEDLITGRGEGYLRLRSTDTQWIQEVAQRHNLDITAVQWVCDQMESNGYLSKIVDEETAEVSFQPTRLLRQYLKTSDDSRKKE